MIAKHAPYVGLIAMHWNEVEEDFYLLVSMVLKLPVLEGAAMISHVSSVTLGNILSIAAANRGPEAAELLAYSVKLFNICRENRNLVVHGRYRCEGPDAGENMYLEKITAHGKIRVTERLITTDELDEIIWEIIIARTFIGNLWSKIYADNEGKSLPWPDRPPLPSKRSETFQEWLPPSPSPRPPSRK